MTAHCPPISPPFPPYPPFPPNPSVGDRFGSWVFNGTTWVVSQVSGLIINVQTFKVSGMYVPSPGLVSVMAQCLGGGGGGGAAYSDISGATFIISGAGGGSGGSSQVTLPGTLVMGGVQVTVGAGGQGGQSGGPSGAPAQAGSPGGVSSFGAFCIANGGGGGAPMQPNVTAGPGGAGAPPGVGDVTFPGAVGQAAFWTSVPAGTWTSGAGSIGGQTHGGNVASIVDIHTGSAGFASWANSGAGGGGAVINQMPTGSELVGGAGGSGLVNVTEYCVVNPNPGMGASPCPPNQGMARISAIDCGEGWGDCGPGVWPPPGGFPPGWTGPMG